jgi:hypothetical protein
MIVKLCFIFHMGTNLISLLLDMQTERRSGVISIPDNYVCGGTELQIPDQAPANLSDGFRSFSHFFRVSFGKVP